MLNESLLNIEQAAGFLNVKKSTLYSWVFQRRVPFVKIGRLVRFNMADLTSWLEKNSNVVE
jgi:excisionase family DNA binding protein